MKIRFSKRFNFWIVTFFGVGKLPWAPGTWGSLAAFVVYLFPQELRNDLILACIIVFTLISIGIIKKFERLWGKDPSIIVIDEVIGMWILMLSTFFEKIEYILLGFFLFRILDIIKPFPINKVNDKDGAIYVLLDDILAALFTIVILALIDYIRYS